VLDSLGCALGALDGDPVKMIAEQSREFCGEKLSAQIGAGRTAPDRAALYNGAGPLPAVVEVLSASASA
jgi:2-methylcitrate dehydratase